MAGSVIWRLAVVDLGRQSRALVGARWAMAVARCRPGEGRWRPLVAAAARDCLMALCSRSCLDLDGEGSYE